MELMPDEVRTALIEAGIAHRVAIENLSPAEAIDYALSMRPITRLFIPAPRRTWLLASICPHYTFMAFGLVDLGTGVPKIKHIHLEDLLAAYETFGLALQRDPFFEARGSLNDYGLEAILCGQYVDLPTSEDSRRPAINSHLTAEEIRLKAEHQVDINDALQLRSIALEGQRKADAYLRSIYEQQQRAGPPAESDE